MLQSAIGQHFFQDYPLRQQMSSMIDGASQILSAIEQYAREGSFNGQVATQGMIFRRSLYSSLWDSKSCVLNQIGGVTQEMAAKLKDNGISTFADAVNSSDGFIAKACNVPASFASSLKGECDQYYNMHLHSTGLCLIILFRFKPCILLWCKPRSCCLEDTSTHAEAVSVCQRNCWWGTRTVCQVRTESGGSC